MVSPNASADESSDHAKTGRTTVHRINPVPGCTFPNPDNIHFLDIERRDDVVIGELSRRGLLLPMLQRMLIGRDLTVIECDHGTLNRFQYHSTPGDSGFTWVRLACRKSCTYSRNHNHEHPHTKPS